MIKLVAFQGPCGSGKTTLQGIMNLKKIVSYTSRQIRSDETNGKDYHFATEEQLNRMDENGELLEKSEYNGNWYATSLESVKNITDDVHSIVVDNNGVQMLRTYFGEYLMTIGLYAPYEDCASRLDARSPGSSIERLRSFEDEVKQLFDCDLIINNSKLNKPRAELFVHIIKNELTKGMNNIER